VIQTCGGQTYGEASRKWGSLEERCLLLYWRLRERGWQGGHCYNRLQNSGRPGAFGAIAAGSDGVVRIDPLPTPRLRPAHDVEASLR